MIVLIDTSGIVRFATPSAERVLGVPPSALVGQPAEAIAEENLVHPDPR